VRSVNGVAFDLLLSGGTLVNGTGAPRRLADVGTRGERIVAVGDLQQHETQRRLDVSGLFVAPGFIDIHAHSELTLLVDPRAASKVRQGITTELSGQCGLSAAPLLGQARDELCVWADRLGLEPDWDSLEDYFRLLENQGLALNFGTLTAQPGHPQRPNWMRWPGCWPSL
jgi:N-acyl-D-amino-acid deacylase